MMMNPQELFLAILLGICIGASLAIGVFIVKQSVKQKIALGKFDIPLTDEQHKNLQALMQSVEEDLHSCDLPDSTLNDVEVVVSCIVVSIEGKPETIEAVEAAYHGLARQVS